LAGSNRDDRPRSDDAVAIRIDSPLPNPWTEEALLRYYPEEDIVQLGPGSFVRLYAELAADVEAARAPGSDGSGVPWAVVAVPSPRLCSWCSRPPRWRDAFGCGFRRSPPETRIRDPEASSRA
jgi:hypothetical protein